MHRSRCSASRATIRDCYTRTTSPRCRRAGATACAISRPIRWSPASSTQTMRRGGSGRRRSRVRAGASTASSSTSASARRRKRTCSKATSVFARLSSRRRASCCISARKARSSNSIRRPRPCTARRGFENDVMTAAGERRVLAWYVTRTLDREGRPTGIVASGHDITERKLAEEALFSSQKMLRLVLDSIPVRVYWKDQNLKYLGCNSLFAKDVGLSRPEDIVGKSDEELGWLEWKEMHEACDRNIMETGVPKLHFETPILSRGDGELWLSISKMPLTDLKNNVVGILSSYEDITDRRKAEQKAAERNLRLTRLTELSLTLSGDPDEVFQNAARMIGELLNVRIVCLSEVRDLENKYVSI